MAGGGGKVRTLDPRGRIVAVALFAVVVVSLDDLAVLAASVGIAMVPFLFARLPMIRTLKRVAAMDGFIVLLLLMLPFTTPGETWFALGPLVATREGGVLAIGIALKANAVMLALLSLVGTIEATALGHALHRLRLPETLVHLLLFTVRYIEVLRREHATLRQAMTARGFRMRADLHTYRSIGYLLGMMLVRSLERSERILGAMKCRGFQGRFHLLGVFRWRRRDTWFVALTLAVLAGLVILEHRHGLPA